MEQMLADIFRDPKNLSDRLRDFCRDYFVWNFHFKPLFGGILVEVAGRLNMDLLLAENDWKKLLKELRGLPGDVWKMRETSVKGMTLVRLSFLEGAGRQEFQLPRTLSQLGLDEQRAAALAQLIQRNSGVVVVAGPASQQKQEAVFALTHLACGAAFRRAGGWVDAKRFPPMEHVSWFNASGVEEFALRELKTLLRSPFDVLIWEAGEQPEVWGRLLQASRDQLVLASYAGMSAMDTLLALRDWKLSKDMLTEISAVLTVFPMKYTAAGKPGAPATGCVFELLLLDGRLQPTWLAGGSREQMIDVAAEQPTYWTLYADGMRGVEKGWFEPETVKRRLAWMTA